MKEVKYFETKSQGRRYEKGEMFLNEIILHK